MAKGKVLGTLRVEDIPAHGTADVALILDCTEWRIRNFSQGESFGLGLPHTVGRGRRKTRLYSDREVCKIAIASALDKAGFAPGTIGAAIEAIEHAADSLPGDWLRQVKDGRKRHNLPVLTRTPKGWQLTRREKARDALESAQWAFVLDFLAVWADVVQREAVLRKQGKLSESLWEGR